MIFNRIELFCTNNLLFSEHLFLLLLFGNIFQNLRVSSPAPVTIF